MNLIYTALIRWLLPLLGLWIVLRCAWDLLRERRKDGRAVMTLLLVTIFQGLNGFGFWLTGLRWAVMGYFAMAILQWTMLLCYVLAGKRGFALETLLYFLCTMGLGVVLAVKPAEAAKQIVAVALGVAVYLLVIRMFASQNKMVARSMAVLSVLLPVVTLLFGESYYGAKNWLVIGSVSFQPGEIGKICYVYAGSVLPKGKRGFAFLLTCTGAVCVCLIAMNDFGTAAVFFAAFLAMALLRGGLWAALGLGVAGTGFAAWRLPAHALKRLAQWRHIWEQPLGGGFQQTRGLMCIASGGLVGLGIGAGKMQGIFASDSDLVFATLCETWGIGLATLPVMALAVLLIYTVKRAEQRNGCHILAGCCGAVVLVTQGALNVLGSVDWLPLTGVTMPFVSNGGSAMVGSWGLAALIKVMEGRKHGQTD